MKKRSQPRDFSTPRRMGWGALFVILINGLIRFVKNIWIILIPIFLRNGHYDKFTVIWIALGLLIIIMLFHPLLRYFTTRIQIKDGKIITTTGLLHKEIKTIPLNRIHALRTKSGPIYQAVDMVGVVFDTIAEEGTELEFILSEEDWQMMLSQVSPSERSDTDLLQETKEKDEPIREVYHMSPIQIIRSTLLQNHLKGLWMIILALWYIYSQLNDYQWIIDKVVSYTEAQLIGASILFYVVTFIVAYISGVLILCVRMLIRYWGLQISLYEDRIEYEAGLIVRRSLRLHRDKVIALAIKQNYLEKKLGCMTFKLQQASYVGGEKGEEQLIIIGMHKPQLILDWWYGKSESVSKTLILKGHSQFGLFWRHLFIRYIILSLFALIVHIIYPPLLYILPLFIIIFGIESWLRFCKSKIELYGDRIVVYSGLFAYRTLVMPMDRIERVQRRQLYLFGHPFRAGHLVIKTRDDDVQIRSLRLPLLARAYDYLLFRSSVIAK